MRNLHSSWNESMPPSGKTVMQLSGKRWKCAWVKSECSWYGVRTGMKQRVGRNKSIPGRSYCDFVAFVRHRTRSYNRHTNMAIIFIGTHKISEVAMHLWQHWFFFWKLFDIISRCSRIGKCGGRFRVPLWGGVKVHDLNGGSSPPSVTNSLSGTEDEVNLKV